VTVSRPIFKKGFIGIGEYRVQSVNLNGDFVESISLISRKDPSKEITYQFYPTEDALKTALVLGNISKAYGIKNTEFLNKNLLNFPNLISEKKIDYSQLVTIFYNTHDPYLSDKRLREALSYAIPDNFIYGLRNYGPFNPNSWVASDGLTTYRQDFEHSKLLLKESEIASNSSLLVFEIKTLSQYKDLARIIQKEWKKIGINTKIKIVDSKPNDFQIFLGDFNLPRDPDEYTLWHSNQQNNITNYKNLRIDKLLEDGRQTVDINERKKIYQDLQKYILDDPPATFLYFPYVYNLIRK
jgi:peptide/nickel transport system substrate-binding protein